MVRAVVLLLVLKVSQLLGKAKVVVCGSSFQTVGICIIDPFAFDVIMVVLCITCISEAICV